MWELSTVPQPRRALCVIRVRGGFERASKVPAVSSNGNRKPPRPRIEMLGPAQPDEAAAVVAAVEQFIAETAPVSEPAPTVNPWQRAALLEGVNSGAPIVAPWGEPRGWGSRD